MDRLGEELEVVPFGLGFAHQLAGGSLAGEEQDACLGQLAAQLHAELDAGHSGHQHIGEHGVGLVKNGQLALQWPDRALELHEGIKQLLDPKGLLNPGKKLAR